MDPSKLQLSPITLVCGRICSGKSTFCKQLATQHNCEYITVSKIVSQLLSDQQTSRSNLQNTGALVEQISEELDRQITDALEQSDMVIVDGIRQPEIVEYLISVFSLGKITLLWIDPGDKERQTRWKLRNAAKDNNQTMLQQEAADDALGLNIIEQWISKIATNNCIPKTLITI